MQNKRSNAHDGKNRKTISRTRRIGWLALAGLLLLLTNTIVLVFARNSVENNIVQQAASDLPLLKNRWPQFKKALESLRDPIAKDLAKSGRLEVDSPVRELMDSLTAAHSVPLFNSIDQGYIRAHIEVVYFERGVVRPIVWHWAPPVDTSLHATELQTRVSLQQLEQTELISTNGLVENVTMPDSLIGERRALVFFYLHTEWKHYETLIKVLSRSSEILSLLTTFLIALWIYGVTGRIGFSLAVVLTGVVGLIIYSSLVLKAISLRTILTMLITLQFGANANRASDFAGLSFVVGSGYGLLLVALARLPAGLVCPECSRAVSDTYRFCPSCNCVLKRNCARCSAPVDTRWNYCPSCSEDI